MLGYALCPRPDRLLSVLVSLAACDTDTDANDSSAEESESGNESESGTTTGLDDSCAPWFVDKGEFLLAGARNRL